MEPFLERDALNLCEALPASPAGASPSLRPSDFGFRICLPSRLWGMLAKPYE
ncbi:MAG: hypothetical protein H7A46_04700 [Verrucomicrobiales bacterium]|nr:hypothetical protein [Verrucomicrobiales bacterium]